MLKVGKCKLQALAAAATLAAPFIGLGQTTGTWTSDTPTGTWNLDSNWSSNQAPGIPSAGGSAVLPGVPLLNQQITITVPDTYSETLGQILFQASGVAAYTVVGNGSFTMANNGTIDVVTGGTGTFNAVLASAPSSNLYKTGSGTLVLGATSNAQFGANSGLQISGGVLQANTSASLNGLTAISTAGTGQIILNNVNVMNGFTLMGLGSSAATGAVRSLAGNNTWAGFALLAQSSSIGVDAGSLTLTGFIADGNQTSANGFTKVGAGALTADSVQLQGALTNTAGLLNLTGVSNSTANSVIVNGGTVAISNGTFTNTNASSVNAGGAMTLTSATFGGNVTVGGGRLNINAGTLAGTATVNSGTSSFSGTTVVSGLALNGGSNKITSGVLKVDSFAVAGGATPTAALDITSSKMIVHSTSFANGQTARNALNNLVLKGMNGRDGNDQANWSGNGIVSSSARALNIPEGYDHYAVGAVLNGDLDTIGINGAFSTFGGVSVTGNDVLVRYTYNGDADLSGKVDGDDYSYWLNGYLHGNDPSINGWVNGDFDYNGVVNGDDYSAWLNSYLAGSPTLSGASLSAVMAMFPGPGQLAQVPEPATLSMLGAGIMMLASRRRRKI